MDNTFKINSKKYTVELKANALAEVEQMTGLTLWGFSGVGFGVLRALLYAGIKDQHGVKTLEHAGDLLDLDRQAITDAVIAAYNKIFE